jgi:ABC-2 type transport system ATP-binding protein
MTRRITLIAAAICVAALPATAQAQEVTKKELVFDVLVGPKDDTHCNVRANLFTPAGVSKANPAPAILATNGFGGSKADFDTLGPSYAKRGYVFLAYSGLGFGGSGCKIQLDDPDWDGKSGSQLVSFLGGSKAATDGTKIDYVARDDLAHDGSTRDDDPRVGMIGGSYGGQIQFAIAGIDARLDTIVPQITWNDLSYSLTPNNSDFVKGVTYGTPGVAKLDWPVLFTALGLSGISQVFTEQDPSHIGVCPNYDDRVCAGLVQSGSTGYPDEATLALLRHASVANYMASIRIPTFLSQGQSDTLFDLQEAVATYKALRAQKTPVKLLWRSAGHSGGGLGAAESDSVNLEKAYESRLALEWFDFYLQGIDDPPALNFSFLRDWVPYTGDAAPSVGTTPTYPAATDQSLYLSSGAALVTSKADVKAGSASIAAVPGTITGNGGGFQSVPAPDGPGLATSFTGAPLTEDVDVVGIPSVTLKIDAPTFAQTQGSGPAGKLVLFAKLIDFDPAASKETLPRNQLSAVRVADVTKPLKIELPGISYRFKKGHQLRLTITTSNSTNRGNVLGGPVTIGLDAAAPSVLTIPRLGTQTSPVGAGPSGTTTFAPSPDAPKPVQAERPPAITRAAAALPSSKRCASRRSFRIRLAKAPKGDRIRSAVVTVNGKRVKVLTGKRLTAKINLRGLPKGTARVMVVVRTKKGRTLRSARTYRTCTAKKR